MFLQFVPPDAITTGNPRVDGWIQVGIVTASAAATLASILKGRSNRKAKRTPARRHTPAPVPRSVAQKQLDALKVRG